MLSLGSLLQCLLEEALFPLYGKFYRNFRLNFTVTEEWRALEISVLRCSEFFSNLMHLILFRCIKEVS